MITQLLLLSHDSRRGTAIGQHIADGGPAIGVTVATSWEDAHRKLDGASFDAVYVDDAPDGDGIGRTALAVRDVRPRIRLIVARAAHDPASEPDMYGTLGVDDVIPRVDEPDQVAATLLLVLRHASPRRSSPDTCVGRGIQQMELEQTLVRACDGHGSVVVCRGEAGLGKTRGSRWLGSRVEHHDGVVLWANGQEGARLRPYGFWADVFDQLVARDPKSREHAVQILKCVPDFAVLVPQLRDLRPPANSRDRVPDVEALRRAAETFLRDAANRSLIFIGFDDAHLADRYSLELLVHIATTVTQVRALVFVTYRNDELAPEAIIDAIRSLEGLSATVTLQLRPLSRYDIGDFLRRHLGRPPTQDELALACAMTGGNPRNLTNWVHHGDGSASRDHGSVERWLVEQIDRIPELDREALLIAAVIGNEFDPRLLADIWNDNRRRQEAQPVDGLLNDLQRRHLVAPVPGSARYAFTCPAIREGLYAHCPDPRRLHGRIALALTRIHRGTNGQPMVIADHFLRADSPRYLKQTLAAVDAAVGMACGHCEYEQAIKYLTRLLDGRVLARADTERCDRLCQLAKLLWQRGRGREAEARATEAYDIARRRRDPSRVALAALSWASRGRGFGTASPNLSLVKVLEAALEGIRGRDATLEARLAASLADELRFAASERIEHLVQRARRAAQRANDRAVMAEVASQVQWSRWETTELDDRSILLEELAADPHDSRRQFDVAYARVWSAYERGKPHVELFIDKCSRIASELGDPYYHWLVGLAELCLGMGRTHLPLDESWLLARMEQVRNYGIEAGNPHMAGLYFAVQLAMAWFWTGRLADHARYVSGLRKPFPALGSVTHSVLASAYAYDGRLDDARREISLVSIDRLPKNDTWLLNVCTLIEACAEVRDHPRLAALYHLLLPHKGRMVILPPAAVLLPVEYHLGRAACAMGQVHTSIQHHEAASTIEEPMNRPVAMACLRLGMAEAVRALGTVDDRNRAHDLVTCVLETCDRLALEGLRRRATALMNAPAHGAVHRTPLAGRLTKDGDLWWFQLGTGPLVSISDSRGADVLAMILEHHDGALAEAMCNALDNRGPQPALLEAPDHLGERTHRQRNGPVDDGAWRQINEAKRALEIAEETNSPETEILRKIVRELYDRKSEDRRPAAKRPETRILNLLKRTYDKIGRSDPAAAQHLRIHVSTGKWCCYVPDPENPVIWTIAWGGRHEPSQ